MADIFGKDGRLIIPLDDREQKLKSTSENKVRYIIKEAYCPNGCNVIDKENEINGFPGIRIRFRRKEKEGEFVVSAIEGDFTKKILSGQLKTGAKYNLFCPFCDAKFEILVNCNCKPKAEMVVIGLTPKLSFNDAITFCNVIGCANGAYIHSGEAIRHARLQGF